MAGNSVVLKISAQTPLVAEWFAKAFEAAELPTGVFNYLHLTREDVQECIKSPLIDAVFFTGDAEGGKKVEEAAAGRFISVNLELGGNDPAYIRKDAVLDQAVATVIDGAFNNSGQSCCGISRVYVHESIYDQFIEKAVAIVNEYRLGRPDLPETTIGPVVRIQNAEVVREQIRLAIAQGAKPLIDESYFTCSKPGTAYLAPQILANVNHKMPIMTEEVFGPVVGVMSVSDDKQAIQLMNDSQYGLSAAVFTQDIQQGMLIGEQIDTGTYFINLCDFLDPSLAWVGVKNSGRGCSLSKIGYEFLTRPKSFHIKISM